MPSQSVLYARCHVYSQPQFFADLGEAYNTDRSERFVPHPYAYPPGLMSYIWRFAVQMTVSLDEYFFPYDDFEPVVHPASYGEFLNAVLLFCRYVRFLRLADHVDLAVFFHLVIHSHLLVDFGGHRQYFACCLMVVCMQALDTSTCLTFTSFWSPDDAAGEGLKA